MSALSGDDAAVTRPLSGETTLLSLPALEWFVTIAWHPQTPLIGATWRCRAGTTPLRLGRGQPLFTTLDGSVVSLGDIHISRRAASLRPIADGWCLQREAGACRLRVDGREVDRRENLAEDALRRGVSLTLGEQVLLHLRLRGEMSDAEASEPALDALRGVGAVAQQLRSDLRKAAQSGDDVLLIGPTGTGKELVARALHALAAPPGSPWVAVNMAALPVEIAAASLFGARRGAYTGAVADQTGYFQRAAGGSLFLDEIGDTPRELQPLLLRALQEREVQMLGGPPQRVDLRVISAMERDPDDPALGFRRALRFRLGAQELRLPALAERAEDIGLLARGFLEEWAIGAGRRGFAERIPAREQARWVRLFELLLAYGWPGNVRELRHVIAQLAPAGDTVPAISPELLQRLRAGRTGAPAAPAGGDDTVAEAGQPVLEPVPVRLADLDDEAFQCAWREAGYEVAALARQLGVSRAAVYRRIRSAVRCRLAADVPLAELLGALETCRGDLAATADRLAVSRRGLEARLRASGVQAPGGVPEAPAGL